MTNDLYQAKNIMNSESLSCTLKKGEIIYKSTERGVKPLLKLLESGTDCTGFSAADRVCGKATAFLYILLGVIEVYSPTVSRGAEDIFEKYGIAFYFDKLEDYILNRTKSSICPIEHSVLEINSPKDALVIIKNKIREMSEV